MVRSIVTMTVSLEIGDNHSGDRTMSKRTRRTLELGLLVVLLGLLMSRLPTYSLVVVAGPNGTTVVEHSGSGPHTVRVEGADGAVAESRTW
jgi:hypothetical protein